MKPIPRAVKTIATAAAFCNLALDSTPVASCEEYVISLWDSVKLMAANLKYRWAERQDAKANPPLYVQLDRMNK